MKNYAIDTKSIKEFKKTLAQFKKTSGLRVLPWRATTDPYHILVSEIMLQQTQVPRVIEKYKIFLKTFPTVQDLAHAALSDVLVLWSGLGYNRRAKFLHQCAQVVVSRHQGVFPKSIEILETLPGVGQYTARAVAAFAYNIPSVLFETNIRTVYIHHFFSDSTEKIKDSTLAPFVEKTLDTKNPREWYWLLMDYGSFLKSTGVKTHKKSTMFSKQTKFAGSFRQIRGVIIKLLTQGSCTKQTITRTLASIANPEVVDRALTELLVEKMIQKKGSRYYL